MARVHVDLSETQDFEPLPAGAYLVAITRYELKKTQAGDPAINYTLTVQEGDYTGRKIWLFGMLVGKGAFVTKNLLKASGIECDSEQLDFDPDDLIGVEILVTLKVEIRNIAGEDRPTNAVEKIQAVPKKKKSA